eukprot:scaffold1313_cov250-Pinguiococcus_pyrenoidosus.AAC.7
MDDELCAAGLTELEERVYRVNASECVAGLAIRPTEGAAALFYSLTGAGTDLHGGLARPLQHRVANASRRRAGLDFRAHWLPAGRSTGP